MWHRDKNWEKNGNLMGKSGGLVNMALSIKQNRHFGRSITTPTSSNYVEKVRPFSQIAPLKAHVKQQ